MTFSYQDYITHYEALQMGSIAAKEELDRILNLECNEELYDLRERTIENLSTALDKLADMQKVLDALNKKHNLDAVFERAWEVTFR